jgi:membrane-associated protease RseP (regulator of RpoE activity)
MAESFRAVPQGFDLPRSSGWLAISAREWRLHGVFFLLTIVTTTLAGMLFIGAPELPPYDPALSSALDYLLYLPLGYAHTIIDVIKLGFAEPRVFAQGATFSASLLAILFSHEMGHYLACRYYKVNATLPYFIPAPPIFLAGTFGAFIKIRSPIPSRRALFDIGLAGPLAGFVVAVPLSVLGVLSMGPPQPPPAEGAIFFNDPLLFRLIAKVMGVPLDPNALPNPYYMAAWIGLLVTSLNLMPVGQLDGGHGTYALFGRRVHRLIAQVAFVSTAALAILGFYWHHSPSGLLYTVLLAVMMRVPHPAPAVIEPLGTRRILIALLTLVVFILCFWPFPITIT